MSNWNGALRNFRQPRELEPGEFVGFLRLIEAVAERQDKPIPPAPQKRQAA